MIYNSYYIHIYNRIFIWRSAPETQICPPQILQNKVIKLIHYLPLYTPSSDVKITKELNLQQLHIYELDATQD